MNKYLSIFFMLVFCQGGFAQTFETESVLLIKYEKRENYYEPVETELSGEDARLFDWKAYENEPVKVVIRRKRDVRIKEDMEGQVSETPVKKDILTEIHRIYSINDGGEKGTYIRSDWEWMDEGQLQGIHCLLIDSLGQKPLLRGLPNVYFQRYWNHKDRAPELLWSDSGECPDEYNETDLPEGEIRIFFQTKDQKTIFRRTIITTLIPLAERRTARIVEIEDERYIR